MSPDARMLMAILVVTLCMGALFWLIVAVAPDNPDQQIRKDCLDAGGSWRDSSGSVECEMP